MNVFFRNIIGISMGCLGMVSCIEEQDFGQYDDLDITPTVEASMLYIEAPEYLADEADDGQVISRDFNFDAFSSDILSERVLDGTITYVAENTTRYDISFRIEFLDVGGNLLYTEIFPVGAMMDFQRDRPYGVSGQNIEIIKNTSSLRVTATIIDESSDPSSLPDPKILLKSSGKFRMRVK